MFVARSSECRFDDDAKERLHRMLRVVCADFEADLLGFHPGPRHLRLRASYPPKHSVSAIVNALKGVSSRRLRAERTDLAPLWCPGLWRPGYLAATSVTVPTALIDRFLQQTGVRPVL